MKISKLGLFGDKVPNHVLINEYLAGQGIMVCIKAGRWLISTKLVSCSICNLYRQKVQKN
jgi:hypothetical protein